MVGLIHREKWALIICACSLQYNLMSRMSHELNVHLVLVNICCFDC